MTVDPVSGRIRPRYGRIAAASGALLTTLVSMVGAAGAFSQPAAAASAHTGPHSSEVATLTATIHQARPAAPLQGPTAHDVPSISTSNSTSNSTPPTTSSDAASVPLPADSGSGRRAVFSESQQRVWLVETDNTVRDTYPVSGSVEDNLSPGTYEVYSRSRHAIGIEDSGTMEYFVRFAHGKHAAIGFHTIPESHGQPLQTTAQLGTPQSHGCIRQLTSDAKEMWAFAPIGTKVVVTA